MKPEAVKALYNNWRETEAELAKAERKISLLKEEIRHLKARLIAAEIKMSGPL